jgi:hypothetical protein
MSYTLVFQDSMGRKFAARLFRVVPSAFSGGGPGAKPLLFSCGPSALPFSGADSSMATCTWDTPMALATCRGVPIDARTFRSDNP